MEITKKEGGNTSKTHLLFSCVSLPEHSSMRHSLPLYLREDAAGRKHCRDLIFFFRKDKVKSQRSRNKRCGKNPQARKQ